MKRNPAGAGYDDDPRRRLRIAAGETCLCENGLSSYPVRVAVLKAFAADERRPIFDVSNRESANNATYTTFDHIAYRWANWPEVVPTLRTLARLGRGET